MILSAWYHINERLPEQDGNYLCMVGSMMTGGNEIKYCRYHSVFQQWKTNEGTQNVVFWTPADPKSWYQYLRDGTWPLAEHSVAEQARQELETAYQHYITLLELTKNT
jgi:CMP-N-acetylneuraminic acid synthetase